MDPREIEGKKPTYIILSAVALLSLLFELVVLKCEQFVYEKEYYQFTITESIVHWVLVCVIWGFVGSVLIYFTARVLKADFAHSSDKPSVPNLLVSIGMVLGVVVSKIFVFGGWKLMTDFYRSGWFQFIFQYVYYIFEVFMLGMVVVFAQTACEKFTKLDKIPWGGLVLALTWGLSHIITQSSVAIGLAYTAYAVIYGLVYLLSEKNIYVFYSLALVMFLL